jgi:hypothetical protein
LLILRKTGQEHWLKSLGVDPANIILGKFLASHALDFATASL